MNSKSLHTFLFGWIRKIFCDFKLKVQLSLKMCQHNQSTNKMNVKKKTKLDSLQFLALLATLSSTPSFNTIMPSKQPKDL